MPKRCHHAPVHLFNPPRPGDVEAEAEHAVATGGRAWVICKRCGAVGYMSQNFPRKRYRWGRGGDDLLGRAQEYNRLAMERELT